MINFKKISDIFNKFLSNGSIEISKDSDLISQIIKINKKLWELEDIARMKELGVENISSTKSEIDKNNQLRNDVIQKIDMFIETLLNNTDLHNMDKYFSETPGMIIDRLSIMFIRKSEINKIVDLIIDRGLKSEYFVKESIVDDQIKQLGSFLDIYFKKVKNKNAYFEIQKAVKIYNDDRIKTYIKNLLKN